MRQRSLGGAAGAASSAGGGVGGLGGFAAQLRSLDLYRKIPRDLTESTAFGGSLSVVFLCCFLVLVYLEVSNFMAVQDVTSIEVDHAEDGVFQINLNLTFSAFHCMYLAVDVENVIGRRRNDLSEGTLHKYALDGAYSGAVNSGSGDEYEHTYDGTDKDVYGVKRYAIELDKASFDDTLNKFEVVIVDFHAPWCPHCRNFAPVFEHAAHLIRERAPHEVDGHHKFSIAMATVDCTAGPNRALCMAQHIQAFPTVLVYRQAKLNKVAGARGTYYEQYVGQRQAEPLAQFALSVLKEVQSADSLALPAPGDVHDVEQDGKPESKVTKPGCRIEGFLMVQRVPGRVIVRPKSAEHSFGTGLLALDHSIRHLSFGKRKPTEVRRLVDDSMEGPYSEKVGRPVVLAEGIDEVPFAANKPNMTWEHYVKVISTTRVPRRGPKIHAYEYTLASNSHTAEALNAVVFSFDLSPLKVVVRETAKPWIEGFTSMAALLGGVAAASVIVESVLSVFYNSITKKLD